MLGYQAMGSSLSDGCYMNVTIILWFFGRPVASCDSDGSMSCQGDERFHKSVILTIFKSSRSHLFRSLLFLAAFLAFSRSGE